MLLLSPLSYFSTLGWINIFAALLVAVGCIGELVLLVSKPPSEEELLKIFQRKKHSQEMLFVFLVAIGVSIELLVLPLELRESAAFNAEAGEARKMAAAANERASVVGKDAALANERAATANKLAGQANERAALLESNNSVLSLQVEALQLSNMVLEMKALGFEKQIAQTSSNITKIEPLNQPVKSMRADVYLSIRGTNDFEAWLKSLGVVSPWLSPKRNNAVLILPKGFIFGKDSALVSLRCTGYESREDPQGRGTDYSMTFSWPSGDGFDEPELITTNNTSAKQLDGKMGSMEIFIAGVKPHSEITRGSCILTINGAIQRRFSIPKYSATLSVECPIIFSEP